MWWGDGGSRTCDNALPGWWVETSTLLRLGIREEVEDPLLLAECWGQDVIDRGWPVAWESCGLEGRVCSVAAGAYVQEVQTNAPLMDATDQGFGSPVVEMSQDGAAENGMADCGTDGREGLGTDKGRYAQQTEEGESCVGGLSGLVCRTARLF